MLRKLSFIFVAGMIAACLTACSEQIKLEKSLTDGQGRWKIDEMSISILYDTVTTIANYDDVGELLFYPTANGVWIQYDTTLLVKIARYFEWENTESQLTFQFDDIPVDSPETVFDIISNAEDSLRLESIEYYDSLGLPTTKTTQLLLKRADDLTHL